MVIFEDFNHFVTNSLQVKMVHGMLRDRQNIGLRFLFILSLCILNKNTCYLIIVL